MTPNYESVESNVKNALKNLDHTLNMYDDIVTRKESKIDSLRASCSFCTCDSQLYQTYDMLFEEYIKWNPDSAYLYANKKMDLALESSSAILINDASMDLAKRHIISGIYNEALEVLKKMDIDVAEENGQITDMYNILYDIYHWLYLVTSDAKLRAHYKEKEEIYLNLRAESTPKNSIAYYISKATTYINQGAPQEAYQILKTALNKKDLLNSEYALLNYWMARVYLDKGDEKTAICYYAKSARYDFMQPIKEYQSLIRISQYCFKTGDIKRAYRYIMRCHIDATECDSKLRLNQLASIMPDIVEAYEKQEDYRYQQLTWTTIWLLVALITLTIISIKLRRSNIRILNANKIKDTYVGEFLSMFAEQIDSLEKYRSRIRKVAKSKDFDILQKELRSDKFIDKEWDHLMEKFDKTFLSIYPNFVNEVNNMLSPDKQVGQNLKEGKLTNELRTLALIRLGINESTLIAQFLRLSLSTVYNYRVKLRNSYVGKRDEFEGYIMQIEPTVNK